MIGLLLVICLQHIMKLGRLYLPIKRARKAKEGQGGIDNLRPFNQQAVRLLNSTSHFSVCVKPPKADRLGNSVCCGGFTSVAATKFPQRSETLSAPTSHLSWQTEGFGFCRDKLLLQQQPAPGSKIEQFCFSRSANLHPFQLPK